MTTGYYWWKPRHTQRSWQIVFVNAATKTVLHYRDNTSQNLGDAATNGTFRGPIEIPRDGDDESHDNTMTAGKGGQE